MLTTNLNVFWVVPKLCNVTPWGELNVFLHCLSFAVMQSRDPSTNVVLLEDAAAVLGVILASGCMGLTSLTGKQKHTEVSQVSFLSFSWRNKYPCHEQMSIRCWWQFAYFMVVVFTTWQNEIRVSGCHSFLIPTANILTIQKTLISTLGYVETAELYSVILTNSWNHHIVMAPCKQVSSSAWQARAFYQQFRDDRVTLISGSKQLYF